MLSVVVWPPDALVSLVMVMVAPRTSCCTAAPSTPQRSATNIARRLTLGIFSTRFSGGAGRSNSELRLRLTHIMILFISCDMRMSMTAVILDTRRVSRKSWCACTATGADACLATFTPRSEQVHSYTALYEQSSMRHRPGTAPARSPHSHVTIDNARWGRSRLPRRTWGALGSPRGTWTARWPQHAARMQPQRVSSVTEDILCDATTTPLHR